MQQIADFIIRNKNFLLFLSLFGFSLLFTIQSHSYHKSKFVNSANFLTGGVYNSLNNVSSYFNLKSQNQLLSEETANIIKNSYSQTNNILTLNKGKNDSIKEDFGVISSKGIIGIVDKTSNNYATVISILNSTISISAQLKKTNHFGTLEWNGVSPKFTQLIDIPKIANVKIGDTIVTSGRSFIFPKNVPIGIIESFQLDQAENYYEINVALFNDMTDVEHVYIIENVNKAEINNLLSIN